MVAMHLAALIPRQNPCLWVGRTMPTRLLIELSSGATACINRIDNRRVCLRSNLWRRRRPWPLARQPAIPATDDYRPVLGGQRRGWPPCRRAYSARDLVVPALVAGISDHSTACLETSDPRLGRDPRPPWRHDRSLDHRHRRVQHPAVLGTRTHPGAQHAVAAVRRTFVRGGMVAGPARRPPDLGAGLRNRALVDRGYGHSAARRRHDTRRHRVQQG